MRNLFTFSFFFIACFIKSQTFSGEIFLHDATSLYLNQVYVTNLNDQKSVLSDFSGSFSIKAKPGDIIRFTSIVTERKDITVTSETLKTPHNIIELRIAYREIEEIVISSFKPSGNLKKDVLALKTGQKAQKIKNYIGLPEPNENASQIGSPIMSLANGGFSFNIESIYDIFSGTRKKKQRLAQYETMMLGIKNMKNYFGNDYFIKLKIPENLIDNFLQFVYSSDNLQPYLANGNFEATKVYIEKYLPIYQRRLKDSNIMNVVLN